MNASSKRRVVVTGLGVISPVGFTIAELWQNLIQGKSGIGYITEASCPNPQDLTCKIAGECTQFDPEQYMPKKEARRMDRYIQFAMAASRQAHEDASLAGNVDPTRFGVLLSTGAGGISTIESALRIALERGFNKVSPFFVPMMLSDSAAGRVSIEFGAKGPNFGVVSACASGADSVGEAFRIIQNNEADVMIAGGAEAPMTPLSVAGFSASRALSTREDEPQRASRPFDKDRDGFVMGEGSGVLVLEALDHALARGAKIYGELIGYGRSSDANDIVAPCPDGDGAYRAMVAAAKDAANIAPEKIGYVNAHATSTPLGDIAETMAVKRFFGDYAKKGLLVSGTKSMSGHLLGAAGSLEAIIALLAVINKEVPPTINLEHQDEQCDLDCVANQARKAPGLTASMSNSFGFGGHNASLIFQAFSKN